MKALCTSSRECERGVGTPREHRGELRHWAWEEMGGESQPSQVILGGRKVPQGTSIVFRDL